MPANGSKNVWDRSTGLVGPGGETDPEVWFPIPDWVPRSVAWMAREIYLDEAEQGGEDVVERLATHSSMRRVWRELSKKKRLRGSSTEYYHPGKPSRAELKWVGDKTDREACQAAAMASLFRGVYNYACQLPAVRNKPRPHSKHRYWNARAQQLRSDLAHFEMNKTSNAENISTHAGQAVTQMKEYRLPAITKRILDAAVAYEELASKPEICPACGQPFWEDADIREAEYLCRAVAWKCKKLFGDHMYNTVTTIAGVVLDRKTTVGSVRVWLGKIL